MKQSGAAFMSLLTITLGLLVCVPGRADATTISIIGLASNAFSSATLVADFNPHTNTFTFTSTNTSAITHPGSTSTITAFGFDLPPLGNVSASGLNGFTGAQAPSLSSSFAFSDGSVGTVPGFGTAVLDFAFLTDATFGGGVVSDGLLPGESASFVVSGAAFAGLTEAEIANAVFVRFLNVPTAAGSGGTDVASPATVPDPATVPEPATGALFLLAAAGVFRSARKRMPRRQ